VVGFRNHQRLLYFGFVNSFLIGSLKGPSLNCVEFSAVNVVIDLIMCRTDVLIVPDRNFLFTAKTHNIITNVPILWHCLAICYSWPSEVAGPHGVVISVFVFMEDNGQTLNIAECCRETFYVYHSACSFLLLFWITRLQCMAFRIPPMVQVFNFRLTG
jgi:hypothetical protein